MTQKTGNGPLRDHAPGAPASVRWRAVRWPAGRWPSGAWARPGRWRTPGVFSSIAALPWVAEVSVALLSALVFSWRAGRPSPWWDEAITRDVTSRPAGSILDLAGHIDLVHTTYYLLVHALIGGSASVTPIRLLSVAAAAATTVVLVRLGRELGSAQVGVFAALFFTIAPLSTRYAQEARPYAMVALAATLSTLALVRVCRRPWLPLRWALYVGSLVAVGLLNVLALLMVLVHLCYVLTTSSTAVRRRWYAACVAAVGLISPLLYASTNQREQVSWLPRPGWQQLTGFLNAQYATGAFVIALLILAVAGLTRGTHVPALGLGLAWAFIPPVVLWTISQAHPLFDWRYVFFTVPGGALALASLAPMIRPRLMVAAVVILALLGLHMQNVYRYAASGHSENLRGAAEAIMNHAQAGDAVIFLPESRRVVKLAFPDDFQIVDDVALAKTGEQSTTLMGVEEPIDEITKELRRRTRVWVVTGQARFGEVPSAPEQAKERLIVDHYRLSGTPLTGRYEVRLYVRGRTVIPSPGIRAGTVQQTR